VPEIPLPRLFNRFIGTIFINAILQVLGNGMTRHVRLIAGFQFKFGIAQQTGRRFFDNPDPEMLAVHRGAVEIHQHRLQRFFNLHVVNRIIGRITHRRFHIGHLPLIFKCDKFHFTVSRCLHRNHPLLSHLKLPIGSSG